MEVFPSMVQYLCCTNCHNILGEGCLICDLGHSLCSGCSRENEECITCSLYISDFKTLTPKVRLNHELTEILKRAFSRCKNPQCKHLFPLYVFMSHSNSCTSQPKEVACISGCGITTKKLPRHLMKKHGVPKEELFAPGTLRIYSNSEDFANSTWSEFIVCVANHQYVLVSPVISNQVFTLCLYNLGPNVLRLKLIARKGWSKIKFEGVVPFYEEKISKTGEFNFWNCETGTLKESLLEIDQNLKKKFFEFKIVRLE